MHYIKGYFKSDLKVYTNTFRCSGSPTKENLSTPQRKDFYSIFVMLKGTAIFDYKKQQFTLKSGNMVFCDVGAKFAYNFFNKEDISYFEILIHPSILSDVSEDKFFLRSLQDFPDEHRLIDLHDNEFLYAKPCVESIINCLNLDLGREHILPRIKSLISELDIYYDRKYSTDIKSTDSISVQIIHYIDRHFTENLTYSFISDKFSVSEPTIRKILRAFTGKTLREYVEKLRIDTFKKRIIEDENVIECSKLCGFNDYTTFLKAYKRIYGKLPSELKKEKEKKYNYPLS